MRKPDHIIVFSFLLLSMLLWTFSASAQKKPKPADYGKDSLNCAKNLASVRQLIKDNKTAEALVPWRWTFRNCPEASESIYIDGAVIFDFLISREQDSARKQILVDTLMMIYDQRIKYFRKEGYVLGRKGVELYQLRPGAEKQAFDILKQSIDIEYRHSRPSILVNYFMIALDLQKSGIIDTIRVYKAYDEIRDILDYNFLYNEKDSQLYFEAKTTVEKAYNDFTPCDELEAKYSPDFLKDTNNVDQIIKIINAFEELKCNGSKFYIYLIKRVYDLNPCGRTAYMAGKFYYTSNHTLLALSYLQTATRQKDSAAKYDAFLLLSDIFQREYHDNANASMQAHMANELYPDRVAPVLLLGNLYYVAADECSTSETERFAMYWIAADQFEKVKTMDPSLTAMANEKLKDIRSHFPDGEFLSRNNLKEGDTYNISCWVNRPTTVKVKP